MLTRDYLRNLALDPEEVIKRRDKYIRKEVENALYNIKINAAKRITKYRINTCLYSTKTDIHTGVLESLRSHLPDSTITVDVLGNGILVNWS
jgi:hypothetical protein